VDDPVVPTEGPAEVEDDEGLGLVGFGEDDGRDSELGGTTERAGGEGVLELVLGEGGVRA
jgi:hypothetical protein